MRTWIMVLVPCVMFLAELGVGATSWDRFEDIPGAPAVQKALANNRRLVAAPRATEVRWDLENKRVFARVDSEWIVVDLAKCETVDGTDLERPAAAQREGGRRRGRGGRGQRPARGRQATSTTSDDGNWTAIHRDHNVIL